VERGDIRGSRGPAIASPGLQTAPTICNPG